MRILVVDDNPLASGLLKAALEGMGHEAAQAADYDSALAACRASAPELVFVDLIMPGRSGLELMETLKSEFPSVVVLAVTAVEQAGVDARIRELGGAGILRKPFSMNGLRKVLADLKEAR